MIPPIRLLQALPIPDKGQEDLSMDFVERLPPSNIKMTVLIIINYLKMYAHFFPRRQHNCFSICVQIALTFALNCWRLRTIFVGNLQKNIFNLHGSRLDHGVSPAIERSNRDYQQQLGDILVVLQIKGQTKIVSNSLETYLGCSAIEIHKSGCNGQQLGKFWYDST